jgi:thiol-disulfide isomerase/thioredoxin
VTCEVIDASKDAARLQEVRTMAVQSTMLPLGARLPEFSLTDVVSKKPIESRDFFGSVTLVAILCNHCPYVRHVRGGFAELAREYGARGVKIIGISSNDVNRYPQDGPGPMAEEAKAAGYVFPYCHDESQDVAKAFRAVCTPEFYVFDRTGTLFYRGQMDDSRPSGGVPVTGKDLRAALDAVLAGRETPSEQLPSIGCTIKWKPGNEPGYL